MKLDVRYSNHPNDSKHYTTADLRTHYLIHKVFEPDQICLTYSHNDRIIAGGVMPVEKELALQGGKELGVEFFLERREAGVINIGGDGIVVLDGKEFVVEQRGHDHFKT